jgi:hypothetical protein
MERGSPAVVLRRVNARIPSFDDLRLVPVIAELALADLLRKEDWSTIRSVMQSAAGIQEGIVDVETATTAADSPNEIRMRLRGLV